jgi:hypothetical protein
VGKVAGENCIYEQKWESVGGENCIYKQKWESVGGENCIYEQTWESVGGEYCSVPILSCPLPHFPNVCSYIQLSPPTFSHVCTYVENVYVRRSSP